MALEGGHSLPRIIHAADATGKAIDATLVQALQAHPHVTLLEAHTAIDLLTPAHHSLNRLDIYAPLSCVGAYLYDQSSGQVKRCVARHTVLATGGLVLLGGPLAKRWSALCGRPLAQALALPVAAQLTCAPAILLATPTVALYAIPANLLVAPAVAPATVLGLAAGAVAPWLPWVAQVLALGAGAACWWIGAVAHLAAAAPGAQLAWQPGTAGIGLLAIACVCVARLLVARRCR